MPWDSRLLTVADAPTMIVTTEQTAQTEFTKIEQLISAGVEILTVREKEHRCDLAETLAVLGKRGLQHVLVEAGPVLLTEFLRQSLADEVRVYIAPVLLGSAGTADLSAQMTALLEKQTLKNVEWTPLTDNIRLTALFR
jgi:diaminohydroxyphosphoribosylaminopyrimidine deaminase/5-amino-6-(5-phosphoribosylamino)uracil reductase